MNLAKVSRKLEFIALDRSGSKFESVVVATPFSPGDTDSPRFLAAPYVIDLKKVRENRQNRESDTRTLKCTTLTLLF